MTDGFDRTSRIVALLRERVRLAPFHRWLFYFAFGVLWASGASWVLIQLFKAPDLGTARTALQTFMMKIHGAAMLVFLVMLGTLLTHVRRGWILRANRVSGCLNIGISVLLALTGWMLYYVSDEMGREWTSLSHWSFGLGALPLLYTHVYVGRASASKRAPNNDTVPTDRHE